MADTEYLSYIQFKTKYQNGYGLGTSTKIKDAYRQYQLKGTLPISTSTVAPTAVSEETPAGGTTPTGAAPTTEYTSLAGVENPTQEQLNAAGFGGPPPPTVAPPAGHPAWSDPQFAGQLAGLSPGDSLTPTAPTATTPTFGEGAAAGIPTPEVTPAPPYEISPEQQAFEDMYGGQLTDWVESGGYGIPEETQNLMIQKQTDSLKAREQENIRVMRNNMERRGITNSGFVFGNEQNIRSNTSVAIAGAIADVQIKSALMKMSSFEKAMGQASQFLGYLSEQSQLKYQPEFATWQAEQMAKMQVWQGKLDVYKMELNQAYQTQNMQLQAQLTSQLNTQQHAWDVEMAQMEIDYAQEAAKAEAGGSISGSVVTGLFAVGAAIL